MDKLILVFAVFAALGAADAIIGNRFGNNILCAGNCVLHGKYFFFFANVFFCRSGITYQ